jgi:hypothetical protein
LEVARFLSEVPQSFLQRQIGQRSRQLGQNRTDRKMARFIIFPHSPSVLQAAC